MKFYFQKSFCYWPPSSVSKRVEAKEIPDKVKWQICKIEIMRYAGVYNIDVLLKAIGLTVS